MLLLLLLFNVWQVVMSGIKRKIEDNDPDYEDVTHIQESKRNKVVEHNNGELGALTHPPIHPPTHRLISRCDDSHLLMSPCPLIDYVLGLLL